MFITSYNLPERILRLLVTQGWFREPKSGYFANNRLSNLIKNGLPGHYLGTYMYVSWRGQAWIFADTIIGMTYSTGSQPVSRK